MLIDFVLVVLTATVYGQYITTNPAVMPLIHKAPHVNSWTTGNESSAIVGHWPQLYSGRSLSWMIAARVDGTGYALQGSHANFTPSKEFATFITPTRTIIMIDAGPVRLNLTYLTPIELDDWTRHSLPFGYFCIDLWSTDGDAHSVQLYSDVSGEFVSTLPIDNLIWRTVVTSTLIYHEASLKSLRERRGDVHSNKTTDETFFTSFGTQLFAFRATPRVAATWQSCYSESCRNNFAEVGKLENISDTNFRAVNSSFPVMAFALDLGNTTQSDSPLAFAIGLFLNSSILYGAGWVPQVSLWQRRWSDIWDAIDSSLLDFPLSLSRAAALDTKIVSDTQKLGLPTPVAANLTNLVIMSVRQTIGSLEITTNRTGPVRLDDLRVFMKDIGNSYRANPVEVIYASFPAFLYLNSSLAGKLLEPLFEINVTTGTYHREYPKLDLGSDWPLIAGNKSSDIPIGVESSGSMIILALAYTQKSGDISLISRYYQLLVMWAEFLVKNSLNMEGFVTADGSHDAMSNLALKAITGIYAMGKINQLLEGHVSGADTNRTSYFLGNAQNYAQRWHNLTWSSTRNLTMSIFGNYETWGLLYNLYAVRLIGADFIPDKVYESQASWYKSYLEEFDMTKRCSMVAYEMSAPDYKTYWAMLGAGSILQDTTGTRDGIIASVHSFTFMSQARYYPNPTTCMSNHSTFVYGGSASPANGAAFVFHALSLPDLVRATPPRPLSQGRQSSYKLGIILAAIAAIIIVGIFVYWRRLDRPRRVDQGSNSPIPYLGEPTTADPHSKRGLSEPVAQQPDVFLNIRFESYAKPSTLRRRAEPEVVHASNEPSSSNGNPETRVNDTQEEDLRREVEQLRTELNEALRIQDGGPPPYTI